MEKKKYLVTVRKTVIVSVAIEAKNKLLAMAEVTGHPENVDVDSDNCILHKEFISSVTAKKFESH